MVDVSRVTNKQIMQKMVIYVLNGIISTWLPALAFAFTILYFSVSIYVYNHPVIEDRLFCD